MSEPGSPHENTSQQTDSHGASAENQVVDSVRQKAQELAAALGLGPEADSWIDDAKVFGVLQESSPAERSALAEAFEQETGKQLAAEFNEKLMIGDADKANSLLQSANELEDKLVALHDAAGRYRGRAADGALAAEILGKATPQERRRLAESYSTKFGTTLEHDFRKKMTEASVTTALESFKKDDFDSEMKRAAVTAEQLWKIVRAVDTDQDGFLTEAEIDKAVEEGRVSGDDAKVLREMKVSFEAIAALNEDQIGREDRISDRDLDKFLKLQATQKEEAHLRRAVQAYIAKNFAKLDQNSDGKITKQEIDEVLFSKLPPNESKVLKILRDRYESICPDYDEDSDFEDPGLTSDDVQRWGRAAMESGEFTLGKRVEAARLNESITYCVPSNRRADFRKLMEFFEQRARVEGLSPAEVAQTYREVSRLLEKTSAGAMRALVAERIMSLAASPYTTRPLVEDCHAAVLESKLYAKYPAAVAKLVVDLFISGDYAAAEGTKVSLDMDELLLSIESGSGEAIHGSLVFQYAALELFQSRNKAGVQTGLSLQKLAEWSNAISGKEEFDVALGAPPVEGNTVHSTVVENQSTLSEKLAALKDENRLPVLVWLHSANDLASTHCKSGTGCSARDSHACLIVDYEPGAATIKSPDDADSRTISVSELYSFMQPT